MGREGTPGFAQHVGSAVLPTSAETSGNPRSVDEHKDVLANWMIAGTNAAHYVFQIGQLLWEPAYKAWFEGQLPLVHLMGKYHPPRTRLAFLSGQRYHRLTWWPQNDFDRTPWGSWFRANVGAYAEGWNDLITERDVMAGQLAKYDVVFDLTTAVMTPEMVQAIADWVKAGGTFVTMPETGRHTDLVPDAWPIAALTNCDVAWRSKGTLAPAPVWSSHYELFQVALEPGQKIFDPAYWNGNKLDLNGVGLKPRGPDVQVVARWTKDNSVAVGLRPLGKGRVLILGAKPYHVNYWQGGITDEWQLHRWINEILTYLGFGSAAAPMFNGRPTGGGARKDPSRSFVSNNGLYDVHLVQNAGAGAKDFTLSVAAGRQPPPWARDVLSGRDLKGRMAGGRIEFDPVNLQPRDLGALLVPRGRIAEAPREWLLLQRGWWQGGGPAGKVFAPAPWDFVLDLTSDWQLVASAGVDAAKSSTVGAPPLAGAKATELKGWIYAASDRPKDATFRREFTVPAGWNRGAVYLHVASIGNNDLGPFAGGGGTYDPAGRVWLDGKVVQDWVGQHTHYDSPSLPTLTAGSTHALIIEVKGGSHASGLRGSAWLEYEPRPDAEVDISGGSWSPSPDFVTWLKPVSLGGTLRGGDCTAPADCASGVCNNKRCSGVFLLRRSDVPADRGTFAGKTVMLHVETAPWPTSNGINGVVVNGRMIERPYTSAAAYARLDFNVTPFIKLDQANEIELKAAGVHAWDLKVEKVSLRAYPVGGGYP